MKAMSEEKRNKLFELASYAAFAGLGMLSVLIGYKIGQKTTQISIECGLEKVFNENPALETPFRDTLQSLTKK